jgi:2-polyprenyl-6-methoxyphenol hydroxylase-like FAD-dependent oxidoreductase
MTTIKRAVIIGGGVAGPATALALRKAGVESAVYEAHADRADGIGATLMLAPNGLNALDVLGVNVRSIGQPIQHQVMADGSGKRWFEFSGLPHLPASRVMSRSELSRALGDEAAAQEIPIEYGKRLIGVDEAASGVVAHFSDGSAATGDVLIGADGIRSRVRKLIDSAAPDARYVGLLGFGGYTADSGVSAPTDTMYFVAGKRAFLGYWTQPNGSVLWFSNLPHATPLTYTEAREIPAAEWLRELRELYSGDVPSQDLIAHTSHADLFVLGAMEALPSVPRWYRDRLVLVGDSAHAPSSSSGQGASLALESSVELARCLRDLPDVHSAFAAYERLRRPRVEKIAATAAKTNNQKAAGPIGKALMTVFMPLAMKTFLKPEKLFGWTHRYQIDWARNVQSANC